MILHRIAQTKNLPRHIVMLVGVIAGSIICMLLGESFFGITEISKQCGNADGKFCNYYEKFRFLRYLNLIV